ncbi:hypothetical protein OROMI_008554 [Orobanche minor]
MERTNLEGAKRRRRTGPYILESSSSGCSSRTYNISLASGSSNNFVPVEGLTVLESSVLMNTGIKKPNSTLHSVNRSIEKDNYTFQHSSSSSKCYASIDLSTGHQILQDSEAGLKEDPADIMILATLYGSVYIVVLFFGTTRGKIQLPSMRDPPDEYKNLLYGSSKLSKRFVEGIRMYNIMFSFTSMGGKIDRSLNDGRSAPIFRLNGENYHFMGSLLPIRSPNAMFAQLYIYETQNEISNRMSFIRQEKDDGDVHVDIVKLIKKILDKNNIFVHWFRFAGEKLRDDSVVDIKLRLVCQRNYDGRRYNLPQANEVAALIVGDIDDLHADRDIIVESRSGYLQRISELHVSYLPLQYPLLFLYGEDGFRDDVLHCDTLKSKERLQKHVTLREYFVYRLQERSDLRCDSYTALDDAVHRGDANSISTGKRIILPSSFTVVYTIEFQKRGLPHAHILVFLRDVDNSRNSGLVDDFISAEIPDKNVDEVYYDAVSEYMIHGPCVLANKNSPCMLNGRCTKHFPKKFVDNTTIDVEGYVVYRRRSDGRRVVKNGIALDNR